MDPQEDKDIIVFGLDFGTTFSGVSWAYSKEPDSITTITSWPTQQSHCSDKDKAPSKISFNDDDSSKVLAWGYNASDAASCAEWFKLLLLEADHVPVHILHSDHYIQAVKAAEDLGKTNVELIANYLKVIWCHTLEVIERSESPEFLEVCGFQIVVTLPAIWPEYTKKRMTTALKKAGILDARDAGSTTLRFVSEPEAAALATITDLGRRPNIQAGQTMIICDAGGGTVDLITYEIQQVRPFVVREVVEGDGELCGGVFLDQDFVSFIKSNIGEENWNGIPDIEKQKFLNYEWENGIKPQFSDRDERKWRLNVPQPQGGIEHGFQMGSISLEVSTQDLRNVFQHVTDRIIELVRRQGNTLFAKTSKKPDHIVLVGGFGRCRHLYNCVQAVAADFGASLLQPQGSKPWSAISRGAVIHGITRLNLTPNLGVTVSSRIARYSYGIKYCTNFVEDDHHEEDKQWYASEGVFKATDQGDDIDDHEPVEQKFYNIVDRNLLENMEEVPLVIYKSDAWPPPRRGKDERVREEYVMDWQGIVQYSKLPKWRNTATGQTFRKLDYTIRMKCDLGQMEFCIVVGGTEYDTGSRLKVDFET